MKANWKRQFTSNLKKKPPKTRAERKDAVTLDRAFSKSGALSRTDAARRIRAGEVSVNGRVVRDPERWVSLTRDRITCKGELLKERKKVYLMLYKPKGVVTTHRDPEGRRTVYDLLNGVDDWVFPVGRLDKDTSGLLLMTNDTEFSASLTNPLSKIPKTYQVKVNFHPSQEQLKILEGGMILKKGDRTLPARVRVIRETVKCAHLDITIIEGKNRQVRRMIECLEGKVLKLVRRRIGNLSLGYLQVGGYRFMDHKDLLLLKQQPTD
jgi:23S rRNA pseudouridine2605 synthase